MPATVTLSGQLLHPDTAAPLSGQVVFTPSATRLASANEDIILAGSVTAALDEEGAFSVDLLATDADGVLPTGWTWQVDEQLQGARRRMYYLSLPASLGTAQLADLAPTVESAGVGGAAGAPVGAAGGALTGSYPNPTLAAATIALFDPAGSADAAETAAAADATAKVAAHAATDDPHGDRAAAASNLADHAADTTDVHGITDTAALETQAGATAKVSAHTAASDPHGDRVVAAAALAAHEADTTGVHGIVDTGALETQAGATAKVSTHTGASDPHGDRAFTTTSIATHAAAADPHGDRAAAAAALAAHEADTTAVHGIPDTAALETTSGATAKVSTHATADDPHGDRAYTDNALALIWMGAA